MCPNIARVDVVSCKYRIMWPWSLYLLTSLIEGAVVLNFVFFIAKIAESCCEIALKNIETPSIPLAQRCMIPESHKKHSEQLGGGPATATFGKDQYHTCIIVYLYT